jgi:hypothetical protein
MDARASAIRIASGTTSGSYRKAACAPSGLRENTVVSYLALKRQALFLCPFGADPALFRKTPATESMDGLVLANINTSTYLGSAIQPAQRAGRTQPRAEAARPMPWERKQTQVRGGLKGRENLANWPTARVCSRGLSGRTGLSSLPSPGHRPDGLSPGLSSAGPLGRAIGRLTNTRPNFRARVFRYRLLAKRSGPFGGLRHVRAPLIRAAGRRRKEIMPAIPLGEGQG